MVIVYKIPGGYLMINNAPNPRPCFDPAELQVVGYYEPPILVLPPTPIYKTPISARENLMLALNGEKPYWFPSVGILGGDYRVFRPRMFPDNYAAHFVFDGESPIADYGELIKTCWFNVVQRFVVEVGGPMVVPGTQVMKEISDWRKLEFPNLDDLDWEQSARANKDYLNSDRPAEFCVVAGYWERLMMLLDVSAGLISLVSEDEKDDVHALFNKLSNFYEDLIERAVHYYKPEIFLMHDDWGTQKAPFFSYDTCKEMIFPYLKRTVDLCHKHGVKFELHCCGKVELLVPLMIDAGVDLWCGQNINDYVMLAHKYKDQKILFGVEVPPLPSEASDDDILKSAQDFVDRYKDAPVGIVNYASPPKMYEYLYELSRKALSSL